MNRMTEAVKHLIVINVIMFLATMFLNSSLQNVLALYYPTNPNFGFWQYLTSMFMHSQRNVFHILFNMYMLWMFGSIMEQTWGTKKFVFAYISAGIGAGIIYTLVHYFQFHAIHSELVDFGMSSQEIENLLTNGEYRKVLLNSISEKKLSQIYSIYNVPALGASGAVYGIMAAFAVTYPNLKMGIMFVPVMVKAKHFIPIYILIGLLIGGQNIAHFAHLGGALFGFIMAHYWKNNSFNNKRWN